jgi:hypothetical protein
LDYRLQGHPYWKIAKALHCHPSTAHSLVVAAMKGLLPVEKREAVLQQELARLDLLQAAVYRNAEDGDLPSQEAVLKIMALRGRYLGLLDTNKGGGINIAINGGESALDTGLQVEFVKCVRFGSPERDGKVIEAKPVHDHSQFNGGEKG